MLETGQKISHYRIVEKLGAGGMGEVYRAEDTNLDRQVAIKVLPESLQHDPVAPKRFEREAKSAAAIDHPYICNIFEVGEFEGTSYIAMEYVPGQTLQEELATGRIPFKQALKIGSEIAEALEVAHKKGIVHRDLKPANIMLTEQGHAKVMDFGLAKRVPTEKGHEEDTTSSLTREGSTLGTLSYMSPEQTRGQEVDPRSDIFSFGVILCEMLTGVHPFRKPTPLETANAIMSEDPPPLSRYREGLPELLEHTVRRMLAKSPGERYQMIHEVRTNLGELIDDSGARLSEGAGVSLVSRTGRWMTASAVSALILIILGVALWSLWPTEEPAPLVVTRFPALLPEGETLTGPGSSVALSRDGSRLVYVVRKDGRTQLYKRRFDQVEAEPIPGTEGGGGVFFSPDGNWIGFFADGKLKKVSWLGGAPQTLCETGAPQGGSWDSNDTIVFEPGDLEAGLWRVSASGGRSERLTEPYKIIEGRYVGRYQYPQILPGSDAFLFTTQGSTGGRIVVYVSQTGEYRTVIEQGTGARYIPTGHLVYAHEGDLWVVPFDLDTLQTTGAALPAVKGVKVDADGTAHFSVSDNGSLVYVQGGRAGMQLVWVDRNGEAEPLPLTGSYIQTRLSPDGRRLIFQRWEGDQCDLWLYDLERGSLSPLTGDEGDDWWPLWTPDGKQFFYNSMRDGGEASDLYWKPVDGSGPREILFESESLFENAGSFSPDGKKFLYVQWPFEETGIDIWQLTLDGDRVPRPLLQTRFDEFQPVISSDGRWLAYTSDESGQWEVYVQPFLDSGAALQVSNNGGLEPLWSHDGRELFYRSFSGTQQEGRSSHVADVMMAVSIETEPDLVAGEPSLLFYRDCFT